MHTSAKLTFMIFLAASMTCCPSASAHNLFVLVNSKAGGADTIDVIFEHAPKPGRGGYNKPLLTRGKTWIRNAGGKNVPLKLKEIENAKNKHLQSRTAIGRPRVVVHSVKWGIYRGRLDYFHGKFIDASSAAEFKSVARCHEIPLDLIPSINGASLSITVLFQGKPLVNQRISIWPPQGKSFAKKTDANGTLKLDKLVAGRYSFSTYHTLKDAKGKFEGKPYKGVMHGSSCTIRWPLR